MNKKSNHRCLRSSCKEYLDVHIVRHYAMLFFLIWVLGLTIWLWLLCNHVLETQTRLFCVFSCLTNKKKWEMTNSLNTRIYNQKKGMLMSYFLESHLLLSNVYFLGFYNKKSQFTCEGRRSVYTLFFSETFASCKLMQMRKIVPIKSLHLNETKR